MGSSYRTPYTYSLHINLSKQIQKLFILEYANATVLF